MEYRPTPRSPDVLIVGAGVIGLSLALEVRLRGFHVHVLERALPMAQASTAAAGMLAVEDPYNPLDLRPLSRLSAALYPEFLDRIKELSGLSVPFQTSLALQTFPDGTSRELPEYSIDPRQLAPALLSAVINAGVQVISSCDGTFSVTDEENRANQLLQHAQSIVYATGAWAIADLPITPRKGQMLRVRIPPGVELDHVHRAEHIYVVPRTRGPQAGTALIGATVEDAGFDTSTHPASLASLRRLASDLAPAIANESRAPLVEAWAGLRPATPDGLPLIGELDPADPAAIPDRRRFVATGHFRNGILLAPATAATVADLIERHPPKVSLEAFAPSRFTCASA